MALGVCASPQVLLVTRCNEWQLVVAVHAQVTNLFIVYVLADFVWILVQPATLPSLHSLILGHHVVTILLLTFPLRHPDFAHFTCWDGLTELNTFFLVARRQFPAYFGLLHMYAALLLPTCL
jgi:hypothetical protein